jgi:hypothetical protein
MLLIHIEIFYLNHAGRKHIQLVALDHIPVNQKVGVEICIFRQGCKKESDRALLQMAIWRAAMHMC